MTDSLRHTAPVPLPRGQEPGSASARGGQDTAAQHAAAGAEAPARHRDTDTSASGNVPAAQHTAPSAEAPARRRDADTSASGNAPAAQHAVTGTGAPATRHSVTPANRQADVPAPTAADKQSAPYPTEKTFSAAADAPSADTSATGIPASGTPFAGTMAGDPLLFFPATAFGTPENVHTAWRDVSPEAVFGTESVPARVERLHAMQEVSLTGNPVFQGFVLLLAVTYATLLYRNLGDIRLLLTRVSRERATGERLTEDPGGSGFPRFLNIATTIGMLFMGVMAVKYGDSLMPGRLNELLSHGAVLALSLLATLACAGVVLFQLAAVRLAGAVTLSQPFISQVVLLKRTYFTLAVIITSPVLLLFALCPRGTGGVWFFIIVIQLAVTAILYLREVLNLFISKKISILHWILYLCIVEVFPVSLLWLLVAR